MQARWLVLAVVVACDTGAASLDEDDTEDAVCAQVEAWVSVHGDDLVLRDAPDGNIAEAVTLTSCGNLLTVDGDGTVEVSLQWRTREPRFPWLSCSGTTSCHVATFDQGPVVDGCASVADSECVREDGS